MSNFSIKNRLFFMVGAMATLLVAFSAAALTSMSSGVDSLNTIYLHRVAPLKDLKTVADDYAVLVVDTSHKVRNGNISWSEGISNLDVAEERMGRLWRSYLTNELDLRELRLVEEIRPLVNEANTEIQILREIFENQDMEALTAFTIDDLYPTIDPVSDGFSKLVAVQLDISKELFDGAEASYSFTRNLFIGLLILVLAIMIVTAYRLVNGILGPLNAAIEHCERIASGDLTQELNNQSQDEVGRMIDALNRMGGRLREVVGDVNNAALQINTGSREIASGNMHLSERTEQQAANLEETASSMEEMTATVRQNADNAMSANKLASAAREQAEKGAEVVSGAMSAMAEINGSSQKIADITSVVDEIAFQTNLLALNAAVEAARAGDAGRGFAVVASEVRVLAQRSAEAAKQIKNLIEESVTKVAYGSKLVDESASTLGDIVESIKNVSTIVSEISASSEEQSDGIQQVNLAVNQMDQVTQQNAALVEEAAAAAKTLEEHAVNLEQLMSYFRVGDHRADRPAQLTAPTQIPSRIPSKLPSQGATRAQQRPVAITAPSRAAPARPTPRPPAALNRPAKAPEAQQGNGNEWEEF